MQIFISWSKEASLAVANALKNWLPMVIQQSKPFVSSKDIQAGARWFEEIGSRLENVNIGVLCLTPTNLTEPWLLFEAGALSKAIGQARVIPLLIGFPPSDLTPPLSQFQAIKADREGIMKLLETINQNMKEGSLSQEVLENSFAKNWSDLESHIKQALTNIGKDNSKKTHTRKPEELLEEILSLTRSISQRMSEYDPNSSAQIGLPIFSKSGRINSWPVKKDEFYNIVLEPIALDAEKMGIDAGVKLSARWREMENGSYRLNLLSRFGIYGLVFSGEKLLATLRDGNVDQEITLKIKNTVDRLSIKAQTIKSHSNE